MSKLGRGLAALIPDTTLEESDEPKISEEKVNLLESGPLEIDIQLIKTNPKQPRKHFDEEKIKQLAQSIRNNGLIQPLVVSKKGVNYYELVAGERRLRASKLAGLEKIPVVVKEIKDEKHGLEIALIENIQREDLNPVEEAEAFKRLKDEFNLTQEEIADRASKSRSAIANSLRLLKLPDEILESLRNRQITAGHARTLLGIKNENQLHKKFSEFVEEQPSVREAEDKTRTIREGGKKLATRDPEITALKDELEELLATKVEIKNSKGTGKIIINYYSKEELRGILNKIHGT